MVTKTLAYKISISFGALLALFALASIVSFTNPFEAGPVSFALFYTGIFLTILGLCTVVGLLIRESLGTGLFTQHFWASFRQGVLLGLLVVISLMLQSERILYWWVEVSIILFFLFIEIFFNL